MSTTITQTITQVQRYIWVTFELEGIHCYPEAATNPELATGDERDVSFLAHPHRHMFKFRVQISVTHDDREIEFIQFKRWLISLYNTGTLQLNHQSCEMLANSLMQKICERYPKKHGIIEVSEDGENGALITYSPLQQF